MLVYLELSTKVERLPFILVSQGLVIGLTILAARIYRSRWPLFCEPLLAALLASLFFTTYSARLFGSGLSWYQYGLVLCSVAWLHLLVAAWVDRLPARYPHGLYLGGYGLLTLGVLVSVANLPTFLWTSGGLILAMLASAVLVDLNHHYTWNELAGLFGKPEQDFKPDLRGRPPGAADPRRSLPLPPPETQWTATPSHVPPASV